MDNSTPDEGITIYLPFFGGALVDTMIEVDEIPQDNSNKNDFESLQLLINQCIYATFILYEPK